MGAIVESKIFRVLKPGEDYVVSQQLSIFNNEGLGYLQINSERPILGYGNQTTVSGGNTTDIWAVLLADRKILITSLNLRGGKISLHSPGTMIVLDDTNFSEEILTRERGFMRLMALDNKTQDYSCDGRKRVLTLDNMARITAVETKPKLNDRLFDFLERVSDRIN